MTDRTEKVTLDASEARCQPSGQCNASGRCKRRLAMIPIRYAKMMDGFAEQSMHVGKPKFIQHCSKFLDVAV